MGTVHETSRRMEYGAPPVPAPQWNYRDESPTLDPFGALSAALFAGQTAPRRSVPGAPPDYSSWRAPLVTGGAAPPVAAEVVGRLPPSPDSSSRPARPSREQAVSEYMAEIAGGHLAETETPWGQRAWGAVTGALADSRQRQEDRRADRQFERDWNERIRGDDIPLDLNWREKRDLRREARHARQDESRQAFEERRDARGHERDVRRWDENQNRRDPSRMHPDDVDWFVNAMSRPADPSAARPPAETAPTDPTDYTTPGGDPAADTATEQARRTWQGPIEGSMYHEDRVPDDRLPQGSGTGWIRSADGSRTLTYQAPERSPYALPVEAERALAALNSVRRTADSMRDRAQQNYVPGSPSYQRIMDAADRYEKTYGAEPAERFQHATHMAQNPAQGQNLSVSDQLGLLRYADGRAEAAAAPPKPFIDAYERESEERNFDGPAHSIYRAYESFQRERRRFGKSDIPWTAFVDNIISRAAEDDEQAKSLLESLNTIAEPLPGMAKGGLVQSFARGGLVQSYADGGFVGGCPPGQMLSATGACSTAASQKWTRSQARHRPEQGFADGGTVVRPDSFIDRNPTHIQLVSAAQHIAQQQRENQTHRRQGADSARATRIADEDRRIADEDRRRQLKRDAEDRKWELEQRNWVWQDRLRAQSRGPGTGFRTSSGQRGGGGSMPNHSRAAADATRMDPRGASHANNFGNHVPTGPQNSGLVVTGGDPDVLPHMQGRVPTAAEFHNWRHSDQNTTWDFLSENRRTNRVPSSAVGSAYDRSVARDPNAQLIRPLASEPKPESSRPSSSFRMGPRPSNSSQ